MATIYTLDGNTLTEGLQGSKVCDAAIQAAERMAASRGESVHLVDDDGEWLVGADGSVEEYSDRRATVAMAGRTPRS